MNDVFRCPSCKARLPLEALADHLRVSEPCQAICLTIGGAASISRKKTFSRAGGRPRKAVMQSESYSESHGDDCGANIRTGR